MNVPGEIEFVVNNNVDDDLCQWQVPELDNREDTISEMLDQYAVSIPDCDDHCHNCCRFQPGDETGVPRMEMCLIMTTFIKQRRTPLKQIASTTTAEPRCLVLCRECFMFLAEPSPTLTTEQRKRFEKESNKNENTWPSFCWNMLSGKDTRSEMYYHETYNPSHLWRFISARLRPYWIKSIQNDAVDLSECTKNCVPYRTYKMCTLEYPTPYFKDVTEKYNDFFSNIKEYSIKGFLRALDPTRLPGTIPEEYCKDVVKSDVLPCVRCPWGCAEYFFKSSFHDFTLLVQRHLSKVQLNMSTEASHNMHLVDTSRTDYIRRNGEPEDCVLLNKNWLVLPSAAVIPGRGLVVLVCRNHGTNCSQKRLHCHPPRKPWHNLSSPNPDSLCPIVMKPRIYNRAATRKYNSVATTSVMMANFAGVDVADVALNDTCHGQSEMKFSHEILSLCGRDDILQLAKQKVDEGRISQGLFDDWMEGCRQTHQSDGFASNLALDSLDLYTRGATYCSSYNALILQKHANENNTVPVIVQRRSFPGAVPEDELAFIERSWSPVIYNCQEEDYDKYGCPIKAIRSYYETNSRGAHMIMYAIVGMMSSCSELHYMVDQKLGVHSYKNWTGHILSHIDYEYMKHSDNESVKKSPFRGKRDIQDLLNILENELVNDSTSMDANTVLGDVCKEKYFKFGMQYFMSLFPSEEFPKLVIASSLNELLSSEINLSTKDIIIIVGSECPEGKTGIECGPASMTKFEARFVMSLDGETPPVRTTGSEEFGSWIFSAQHYARHGGNISNWYVQDRTKAKGPASFMTKHTSLSDENDFPLLQHGCFRYVTLYVTTNVKQVEDYKLELHRSLGGQCKIFCSCSNSPLIITGTRRSEKRKCMLDGCDEYEKYICSQSFCQTRLCKDHFDYATKLDGEQTIKHTHLPNCHNANHRNDQVMETYGDNEDEEDSEEEEFDIEENSLDQSMSDFLNSDEYSFSSLQDRGGQLTGNNNNALPFEDLRDDEADLGVEEYFEGDDEVSRSSTEDGDNEFQADLNSDFEFDDLDDRDVHVYNEDEPASQCDMDDAIPIRERLWREHKRRKLGSNATGLRRSLRLAQKKDAQSHDETYFVNDLFQDHVTGSNGNPFIVDSSYNESSVPSTNSADYQVHLLERAGNNGGDRYTMDRNEEGREDNYRIPMHVIFNQTGALCTRYNKRITGLQLQQHVVQKIVSSVSGNSVPVLYLLGMMFPKHFWSSASDDKASILGVLPISCYTKKAHPHGFASMHETAKNYITHASSSTSTCHNFAATLYSVQCNQAMSGFNSKQVLRQGFKVSAIGKSGKSNSGLTLGHNDESNLRESMDTRQGAMNLAAAVHNGVHFDLFVTWTLNQAQFPGVRHLNQWKVSKLWTKEVPGYDTLSTEAKLEIDKSFEMAYISVMNRNWLEVRSFLINLLLESSTAILKKVVHAFFRDEYQELCGNVSHLHGLMGLEKNDMENEEFKQFICDLQRNSVCDLVSTDEIQGMIDDGLLRDEDDWKDVTATAAEILPHICDKRCKIRVAHTGDEKVDFKCKKKDAVLESLDPLTDDFLPVKINPSEACLDALRLCGLYEPPSKEWPTGRFFDPMLYPKRHVGKVTPSATENMSPVNPRFFALTRSMQNAQVITETNGVSRYVVKYVIKMDHGNRCTIFADARTGAVLSAEYQFLHNTKITRSAKNEDEAHASSRRKGKPNGRFISYPEMAHQILGHPDLFCTEEFVEICTKPIEYRPTTKISLTPDGKLRRPDQYQVVNGEGDVVTPGMDACYVRSLMLPVERHLTSNQQLLIRAQTKKSADYDKVTLFGLRPAELLQLFCRIQMYFTWFIIDENPLSIEDMNLGLKQDVTKCMWIDGIGRRVRLRKQALTRAMDYLKSISEEHMLPHSRLLRSHLLQMLERSEVDKLFVAKDDGQRLPIAVFSSVTPDRAVPFLMHMLISFGEFETELDFKQARSLRDCFVRAKLMPEGDMENEEFLHECVKNLLYKAITKVLKLLPISTTRLWVLIVKCRCLLEKVIIENELPMTDYPPCLLTDLLDQRAKEMADEWNNRKELLLTAMLSELPPDMVGLPSREDFRNATKEMPANWDPTEVFARFAGQSEESHREQKTSLILGMRSVHNYLVQFGQVTRTKGVLTHGVPGAGKTFVLMAQGLYAMGKGLRVMSTSLMAIRANQLGGIHLHRLFAFDIKNIKNLHQSAELALEKLGRKTFVKFKHIVLTMDVLLLDECGQISAEQFALLDLVLREARESDLPFGGVLIFGSFDNAQLGAIRGLPFLMSSHILTEFTLIRLKHSVRAHRDQALQDIQNITRMSTDILKVDKTIKARFMNLVESNFTFLNSWNDERLPPNCQRMYSRRKPAAEAADTAATAMVRSLKNRNKEYRECVSEDLEQVDGSRASLREATNAQIIAELNRKVNEPKRLVLFRGGLYESTVNGNGYNQSSLLLMVNVPSDEDIKSWNPIKLFVPPNTRSTEASRQMIDVDNLPTENQLRRDGWTEVSINTAPEKLVRRSNLIGVRKQYTLRHIGTSTINKQMGNTITVPCAIEMTEDCCPWEKEQIVVMLSRSPSANLIYIIGDKTYAIKKMWEIICKKNQWTDLTESILNNLSVNGDSENTTTNPEHRIIDVAQHYPYNMSSIVLPDGEHCNCVYLLVSLTNTSRMYVGETANLGARVKAHNNSNGSVGTAPALFKPYAVAAYFCGATIEKPERMSLEHTWQNMNRMSIEQNGASDIDTMVENGKRIVREYNLNHTVDKHLSMSVFAKSN